jgi:phage baseplate assembly protein W
MELGPDGRFAVATSPDEVWADRLAQLVCARMGERVMRNDYGTNIAAALFENALDDPDTAIREAAQKWLPHITIQKVSVNQVQDTYQIQVDFTTPDNTPLSTTVGLEVPGE